MSNEEPMTSAQSQNDKTCDDMRNYVGLLEKEVRKLVHLLKAEPADSMFPGERIAQAMLAVRHLEDARMRLGKVIQYGRDGGVSIYDQMKQSQPEQAK